MSPFPLASDAPPPRFRLRRTDLIVLLAGLLLAGLALLGGQTEAAHREQDLRHEALQTAAVEAHVVEQLVLRRLEAVDVLHRLTQSWFILREQGNVPGAAALAHELASTANAGSFGFVQVAAIDRNGWLIWSSVPGSGAPVYLGDREHFRVHRDGLAGLFLSQPLTGRVSNRQTIQITRPLHAPDSVAFAGVAVVSLDLLNLSQALGETLLAAEDEAIVLGRGDTLIANSARPETLGQALAPNDPLRAAVTRQHSGTMMRPGRDGRPTATGWARLEGTPLTAVYAVDPAAMIATAAAARRTLMTGAGAMALVALAGATLVVLLGERRRTARALALSRRERELRETAWQQQARRISALPGVIYAGNTGRQGKIHLVEVSDNLRRVTGWEGLDLAEPEVWESHMAPEDVPLRPAFHRSLRQTGEALQEYRFRHRDGRWMTFREHARVVGTGQGTGEIVGYIADVSEEQNLRSRARAAERLAALGEMATGLAHEINQPLGVIALAADNAIRALERRGVEGITEVLKRLERITAQADRARLVVDQVRIFGRYDAGEPVPTDLAQAVEGARVLAEPALHGSNIRLVLDLPADLPMVQAQPVPLEQVLVNLLINARDAVTARTVREGESAPAGEIRLAIAREGEQMVRVTLADNGGGIPADILPRIFEPFFTTKPVGEGSGLGLSICLTTLRGFGGDLLAANTADGAMFTLLLPAAPRAQSAMTLAESPKV